VDASTTDTIIEKEKQLKGLLDSFTYLGDGRELEKAKEILARIGSIDAQVEGLKSTDNQRDLSIKFHWGHNHVFNENLKVGGRMGDRHLSLMAEFMVKNGLDIDYFNGKDVVDVGCWTGGTLLLLKMLGASNVLALEEVQKYAVASRELAQDVYKQDGVVCEGTNIYDLETTHKYDVIYFPGVVYHLSDPVLGLRKLFNAAKDGGEIFVETMGLDSSEPICVYEGNRRYHHAESESQGSLNRGGWNWFVPSASCLERWMLEAGFDGIECYYSHHSKRVFGYGKRTGFKDITRAGLSVRDVE